MTIRKARPEDFEDVFNLFWDFIKSHRVYDRHYYLLLPKRKFAKAYRRIFTASLKSRAGFLLVAEENGKVVGMVRGETVRRHPRLRAGEKQGLITQLAVKKSLRKKGIATELMNAALDRFRKKKLPRAVLQVDADNAPARKLYAKLAFCDRQALMVLELRR
jgi:ribosomal protein S18 acetylase RimI-like enzyme